MEDLERLYLSIDSARRHLEIGHPGNLVMADRQLSRAVDLVNRMRNAAGTASGQETTASSSPVSCQSTDQRSSTATGRPNEG